MLFLSGLGTTKSKLKKLEKALTEICLNNIKITYENNKNTPFFEPVEPRVRYIPSLVWNQPYKEVELKYALARVSMELIMDYPPGIPILAPGERITAEILDYIEYAKIKGCSMTGPEDPEILNINVLE